MSLVIPFSTIVLPVMPLLHNARKIQDTLVYIIALSMEPKLLKRSMTPFWIRMLIDYLFKAKCTRANVLNCLTRISPETSLQRFITKSITPLLISSSNIFS